MAPSDSTTNAKKVAQLEAALRQMLAEALTRGFFGTVAVEVTLQDGTIQHIRRRLDRIER